MVQNAIYLVKDKDTHHDSRLSYKGIVAEGYKGNVSRGQERVCS
jgi:hypothetical protein